MRWFALLLPVTLFYSLSFVNAIPHEVDEKRHWLHKRQDDTGSSKHSVPVASSATPSSDGSSPALTPTSTPATTTQTSDPASSPSSSPTTSTTPQATSDPSSQLTSTPASSTSPSSTSTSTRTPSSSPTSSTSTPAVANANNPNSQNPTSYLHFSSTVNLPSSSVTADGNAATGNGSTTSFLKNKAAMGTVFTIVGLVGAGIIAGASVFLIKKARKRSRDEDELDLYFEKLPAPRSNNRDVGGNDFGLGPSATDLTAPTNNQSYVPRDVHYGSTGQFQNPFANYAGLEYPPDRGSIAERPSSFAPGTAYAAAMHRDEYNYEGQVEDPNTVPNHPFADSQNRRY